MSVIELNTEFAEKCVANGTFQATASDGPSNLPEMQAFRRIRCAPLNDLVSGVAPNDFSDILGMSLDEFVGADCAVLDAVKKTEMWNAILDVAEIYWTGDGRLANPFPRQKFSEPAMDCTDTQINDLTAILINQWRAAQ